MKKKILYISPKFPPLVSSRSIANDLYVSELNKLNYDIKVITAQIPEDHIRFKKDKIITKNKYDTIRTDLGLYGKLYNKKTNNNKTYIKQSNFFNFIKKTIKNFLFFPDNFIYWSKKTHSKINNIILNNDVKAIITASDPMSAHILGKKIKKEHPSIVWIGYFGDPLSLDPTLNYMQKKLLYLIEKNYIKFMDKLVFTTNNTRDLYIENFNIHIEDTSVFSRGYDPKLYKQNQKQNLINSDKIKIVYTGSIGKYRNFNPVISAIKKNSDFFSEKKVEFYFIGPKNMILYNELKSFDFVKFTGIVSFEKSIRYITESDFLLLVDNNNSLQMPAKAFEYLGSNSPIITLTNNKETHLSKLMKKVDRGIITKNSTENIKTVFKKIIKMYNNKKIPSRWKVPPEEYKISNVINEFANNNLNF